MKVAKGGRCSRCRTSPDFLPLLPLLLSAHTTFRKIFSLSVAPSLLPSIIVVNFGHLGADLFFFWRVFLSFPSRRVLDCLSLLLSSILTSTLVLVSWKSFSFATVKLDRSGPICRPFFHHESLLAKSTSASTALSVTNTRQHPFLHRTMAQARDTGFNPSSPHSSSGAADSYKHEGTPDTRLTAFSPDDNSARSNRLLNRTLAVGTATSQDAHSHHFHSHNSSDGYSVAPASGSDKDPFVSTSSITKPDQKLSPTASSFLPVSVPGPLVAHGSANGPKNGMQSLLNAVQPSYAQLDSPKAADKLSTDLSLSRYLVFYSSQPITVVGVEEYLRVCDFALLHNTRIAATRRMELTYITETGETRFACAGQAPCRPRGNQSLASSDRHP